MDVDREELAKTYSEYTDEKLLSMASSGNLTQVATKVLEYELSQRGIPVPQAIKDIQTEKKLKINRLSIVSGVCGGLVIVDHFMIGIVGYLFHLEGSSLNDALLYSIGEFFFGAKWLLALCAVITGIIAVIKIAVGDDNGVQKERGYGIAIFGIVIGISTPILPFFFLA